MAIGHERLPINKSVTEFGVEKAPSTVGGLPNENPLITEEDRMRFSNLNSKAKNIIRRTGRVVHAVTEDLVNYGVFFGTTVGVKLAERGAGGSSRLVEIVVPSAVTLVEAYAYTRVATDRLIPPIVNKNADTPKLSAAKVAGETALHGISWITGTPTVVGIHDEITGHSDMAMRQRLAASFAVASIGLYNGLGVIAEAFDKPWVAPVGLGVIIAASAGLDRVAGNYFNRQTEVLSDLDKTYGLK